jgi:hypothetical protein
MTEYVRIHSGDFTFAFAIDPSDPEMLHIVARHYVQPETVFAVWDDPETVDQWDEQHQRYESSNATHTLLWKWLHDYWGNIEAVLVISCFRR